MQVPKMLDHSMHAKAIAPPHFSNKSNYSNTNHVNTYQNNIPVQ